MRVGALVVAALGVAVAVIITVRPDASLPSLVEPGAALPASPHPAFAIPRPLPLSTSADETRWAPVLHPVVARASPQVRAPVVERLTAETPEGTSNLVPVLRRDQDRTGRIWLRVRVPALPSNREGWVPRTALGGYNLVHTHLVVDLELLQAALYSHGKLIYEAPVGIGKPASPTPRGEFYIRNELTAYHSSFYGPVAFGTSARSRVLTDWPAGGFIGIHGTDRPDLLPGSVSHGCIRMRNSDILQLARLMPVGTPLTIR